ncbi:MAG: AAA family ATPase [bacterium]
MTEEELLNISIPRAKISSNLSTGELLDLQVDYRLEKSKDGLWYLIGEANPTGTPKEDRLLLASEEVVDIMDGSLSVDEYLQDETFQTHQKKLAERLAMSVLSEQGMTTNRERFDVTLEPYILQQHIVQTKGENLLAVLIKELKKSDCCNPIPAYLRVTAPTGFIPDPMTLESLEQRIYEGTPAVALLGPTGSGKSALARYMGARLNNEGYGVYTIDGNARLEGDALFARDDFNKDGTFVLEGILCKLARETKKQEIKLLVVLEEYNSFSDETRREFYRLFSDEDRYYTIQSAKYQNSEAKVDFSNVQFILTANPLSSDRYLTDDMKRLSNAESRRLVILYQDYTKDPKTITKILKSLITKKPAYQKLKQKIPDIDNQINWKLGVDVFKAITDNIEGDSLGWDIGYTPVADFLFTSTLRQHQPQRYVIALSEHILNAIPDINIRSLACERIRQATNIIVPKEYITRGA